MDKVDRRQFWGLLGCMATAWDLDEPETAGLRVQELSELVNIVDPRYRHLSYQEQDKVEDEALRIMTNQMLGDPWDD